jgi:hypothetical protein
VTDATWLASHDPEPMIFYLRGKASDRKYRLFTCACVRRIWPLLVGPGFRQVVLLAEAHADGLEPWVKVKAKAADVYRPFYHNTTWSTEQRIASLLHQQVAGESAWAGAWNVVSDVRFFGKNAALPDWAHEGRRQADLVRHVFANPFRAYFSGRWSSIAIQLAEALYAGENCAFALHDALLEAGHPELAEHFAKEQSHPKGCWVLDLLLGKE